jgi:peptidoglycan hydrolase CwlO-like protein
LFSIPIFDDVVCALECSDALRLQLQAAKSEISDSQTELADAQSELTRLQQQVKLFIYS